MEGAGWWKQDGGKLRVKESLGDCGEVGDMER